MVNYTIFPRLPLCGIAQTCRCRLLRGLLGALEHLGIDPEETLAMGDEGSDLPLLRAAGIAVAMENASEIVKAAADFVTASCDEDGVALALEKYIL